MLESNKEIHMKACITLLRAINTKSIPVYQATAGAKDAQGVRSESIFSEGALRLRRGR